MEMEREEERRRRAEEKRKDAEEALRAKKELREQAKREKSSSKKAAAAAPTEPPPVAEDNVNQALQRAKLEYLIAEQQKAAKAEGQQPVAKWKFEYDGEGTGGAPANKGEEGYREALKQMWQQMHAKESLVWQEGEIRTFPPTSSWFEILAVLREGLRDYGKKLLLEEEMAIMQAADSDLGSDHYDSDEGPTTSEEDKGLELVYRSLVGLKNNGARWLGPNDRLTRLKLLGGIRKLLRLDLSWEQFDNLYRYLSPDAHGKKSFLTMEEFVEAFAHPMVGSPARKKRKKGQEGRKGLTSSVDKDLFGEGTSRGVAMVRRVMGTVANTMIQHGLTLQEILWCFDRNGDQTVSVSEFASLMKLLVGRNVTKHEIYLVMDTIDTSLDRRLQTTELMEFFYRFWSDQLLKTKIQLDRTPLDTNLQKKQHDLRGLLSKNFTREFRDHMKGQEELVGPFAALLRRMGIVPHQQLSQAQYSVMEEEEEQAYKEKVRSFLLSIVGSVRPP